MLDTVTILPLLLAAFTVAFAAGVIKGIVGFAMPMVLISGLSTFMPPEQALAGLILPTLVTNGLQALRQGPRAAWASIRRFRLFLAVGAVALIAASQLVLVIPQKVFLLGLGIPVTLYALATLAGVPMTLSARSKAVSVGMGAFAGAVGGLSGVWGPMTVAYLTAYDLPKAEQMRVQGVIYGLGAVLLVGAHTASGVFNAQSAQFSALLVVPAVAGLAVGFAIQDRMDQRRFKQATLLVLTVAGLNLIRRGLLG
ncbi:MAG: sulfite exporter TauE/SafE family protein [Pseudomonadota bacterium]